MPGPARRVEDLGAGHEDRARAAGEKEPAADAGILGRIMEAPGDPADGERVDDRPGFEAGLDDEKS